MDPTDNDMLDDEQRIAAMDRGDAMEPEPEETQADDEANPMEADTDEAADTELQAESADDEAGSDDEEGGGDTAELAGDDSVEEGEAAEAEDRKPFPNPLIPRERYNQVSDRLKAERAAREKLEARLAELESNQAAPENIDSKIEEKVIEQAEALKDGDSERAAIITKEIMRLQNESFRAQMQSLSSETKNQTRAELELDSFIDAVTEQFPVFDPDSESYDQEIVDEVLFDHSAYIERGMSPADAMRRAVRNAANSGLLSMPDAEPEPASQSKPAARKTDVKRNVEASNKQPPLTKSSGQASASQGNQGIDVLTMNDDEFNALPESKLRELRGDLL